MQLEQFVAETLQQIIGGMTDAHEFAANHDAAINPRGRRTKRRMNVDATDGPSMTSRQVPTRSTTTIDFDVAVTVADSSNTQAGAGAMIAVLGMGMQQQEGVESSVVSRVRFQVPVRLPAQPGS